MEESIDDLQLPMFCANGIGAIHEAVEAFAVGQYIRTLCAQYCLIFKIVIVFADMLLFIIFSLSLFFFIGLFENATLATVHRNKVTMTVQDLKLVRRIQGHDM